MYKSQRPKITTDVINELRHRLGLKLETTDFCTYFNLTTFEYHILYRNRIASYKTAKRISLKLKENMDNIFISLDNGYYKLKPLNIQEPNNEQLKRKLYTSRNTEDHSGDSV